MFEKIKTNLLKILSAQKDTWTNIPSPPVTKREFTIGNVTKVNQPEINPQSNLKGMRDNLIRNEHEEELLSAKSHKVNIVSAGSKIVSSETKRSFSEDGLSETQDDYFLHTAEGRFIKGNELHDGGQCNHCKKFSDRIYFCNLCHSSICFKHTHPWENSTVCPKCYQFLKFNQDTWEKSERLIK